MGARRPEWLDWSAVRLGFDGAIFVGFHDSRCSNIEAWKPPNDV